MDHAEGLKEGIDDVDHQQEESGGRQQRQDDRPNRVQKRAPSIAAASITDFRDRLQAGKEEQESYS